jgi:formylglycine-generating enzyme required for sulfatase activity
MSQPIASDPISAESNIVAHVVNTGQIEQHTHLTLNVIVERLDQLAGVLAQPSGTPRFSASGDLEAVAGEQTPLLLPANLLEAFRQLPRAGDAPLDVRRRAYAVWLVTRHPKTPEQEVAARQHYIPLAGWVSFEDSPLTLQLTERRWVGTGPERRFERIPLPDVTQAMQRHPAFVLLGPPGCGKSTVLRRLTRDTARAYLTGQDTRLPMHVNLANYAGPQANPLAFLRQQWINEGLPGDPVSLIQTSEVVLLADGLNEMERLATEPERRRRANAWQQFFEDYFSDSSSQSRAIVASRDQADYAQPLGLPRVEIDPLSDDQIRAFLHAYLGAQAEGALATIQRLDLLEHARNPYQLSVLAALYDPHGGDLPSNRGRLFAAYAYWLIKREERANHPHWIRAEVQLSALGHLGYAMQVQSESTLLPQDRLLALLPQTVQLERETVTLPKDALFDLACRAGLLIADPTATGPNVYKFSHQLLQEQFAAEQMLTTWQAGHPKASAWWQSPRSPQDMPPAQGGEWDPLPPPPPTGWEQVTILAAGMTDQPDAFVRAIVAVNPALAGRCVSDGAAPVSDETRVAVQQGLLADLGNPDIHRRVRLQAGHVLGTMGDPRFTPQVIRGVKVILPDLVPVQGGTATIGSARWPWDRHADGDERPRHQVEVAHFYLARFPVTNAEYACFIQAGGYDTEDYWTPTGRQWRQGEVESSGPVEDFLEFYQYYRQNPGAIAQHVKEGRMTPEAENGWRDLIKLSEEEARQAFLEMFPTQPHDYPYYWDDPAYNAPNQPVVGVTWYEAMAYCAWLHAQLAASRELFAVAGIAWETLLAAGMWEVRLPTEVEWEWAAGGPEHRRYPSGNTFTVEQANTLEGRVLATSPVGTYPAGAAACGALDLSGNVWEWPHSLYQGYPYKAVDGREDRFAAGRRTLRGGAWRGNHRVARVSARTRTHPDDFGTLIGVRVVVGPVFVSSGS